jgi:hypothetical protein
VSSRSGGSRPSEPSSTFLCNWLCCTLLSSALLWAASQQSGALGVAGVACSLRVKEKPRRDRTLWLGGQRNSFAVCAGCFGKSFTTLKTCMKIVRGPYMF